MNRQLISLIICILIVTGIFVGCNQQTLVNNGEIDENKDIQLGELDFETIEENSIKDDNLKSWFENNYKNEGVSFKEYGEHLYILLGAGEQKTGGYFVEITSVVGKEYEIVVSGKLYGPKEEEMVIQALTYPNAIVRIAKDERGVVLGSFEKPRGASGGDEKLPPVIMEGSGVYIGLVDSNFVEIIVEGNPKEFMISEGIKGYFDADSDTYKDLDANDQVKFSYTEDKDKGYSVIVDIYKNEDINKGENAIIGRYIGQIDGNSIEVEVNDEVGAYRLSEEAKTILQNGTIKEGDSIYFEYNKNEYDQFIILTIKKNPQN